MPREEQSSLKKSVIEVMKTQMAEDFMESAAPYFRQSDTQLSSTVQRICALCILLPLPLVHYGGRVILMVIFGVLTSVGAEALWNYLAKRRQTVSDMTAVETGLACAMLMPACAHYQLVIFTAAAAVTVGKMPFGGRFRTPFVPTAVGYCLAAVCFPTETFTYSQLNENTVAKLFAFGTNDSLPPAYSQIALLRSGEDPFTHINEYLLGEVAGPLGTTSVVLLVIAAVWLFVVGNLAWQSVLSFMAAVAVVSFAVPYHTVSTFMYIVYDLLGGSTLFSCIFMAAYPNYCPKLSTARYLWGGICGALAVLIQHFGSVEAGGVFAVLLMTPFSDAFDRMVWHFRSRGISYRSVKKKIGERIKYRMKTQQERELDEFKATR